MSVEARLAMRTATDLALWTLLLLLLSLRWMASGLPTAKARMQVYCYCVQDPLQEKEVLRYENCRSADDSDLNACYASFTLSRGSQRPRYSLEFRLRYIGNDNRDHNNLLHWFLRLEGFKDDSRAVNVSQAFFLVFDRNERPFLIPLDGVCTCDEGSTYPALEVVGKKCTCPIDHTGRLDLRSAPVHVHVEWQDESGKKHVYTYSPESATPVILFPPESTETQTRTPRASTTTLAKTTASPTDGRGPTRAIGPDTIAGAVFLVCLALIGVTVGVAACVEACKHQSFGNTVRHPSLAVARPTTSSSSSGLRARAPPPFLYRQPAKAAGKRMR